MPGSIFCSSRGFDNHAIASSPLALISASSLSDGPDGFFSPRSHSPTSLTATLRCRARTPWLTPSRSRNFWICRAESGSALVRHRSSNSRIVRLSIRPMSCRSDMASCTSAEILLLNIFVIAYNLAPSPPTRALEFEHVEAHVPVDHVDQAAGVERHVVAL